MFRLNKTNLHIFNREYADSLVINLLTLFFLVLTTSLSSQTKLSGKVFEVNSKGDTAYLPGATLMWLNSNTGTQTDANGEFNLPRVNNAQYLIVRSIGYDNDTIRIDSTANKISLYLKEIKTLKEIEVVYHSNSTQISFMNPIKTELITERELRKAACCNLSESFETNASVDVNFTDAVTGTKQIQMLGLSGQYALITRENMPFLRGLAASQGLTFIPGTWIESIQLSKGAGTVINGYESFTGQINTELKKPETAEKIYFNAYGNANARNEYNLNLARKLSDSWNAGILLHGSLNPLPQDMNGDGFMDIPTGRQINVQPRISFYPKGSNFEWQFGGSYVNDQRKGGKILTGPHAAHDTGRYELNFKTERKEAFSKSGYVFKRKETSMGLQLQFSEHRLKNDYNLNSYIANENSFYANLIFQSFILNTNHKYKAGLSYVMDVLDEKYKQWKFARNEMVPGAFLEYSFSKGDKFNLVAGLRADYSNYYGLFFTPRLHARYGFNANKTVFRASVGRAQKTANFLAENTSYMASSREIILHTSDLSLPYGLQPEVAWNYGLNFSHKFRLNYRESYITADVYRTEFERQTVIDLDAAPNEIHVYNLNNASFSNTAQIEWGWEVRKRLNMKLAYRFVDAQTKFISGYLQRPFVSRHRAFLNASYETKNERWLFDFTTQFHGQKRLPGTEGNPVEHIRSNTSPEFFIVNAQVSHVFKPKKFNLEIYLGVENASNVQQNNAVIAGNDPTGKYFDASRVWGPIYGRMIYGGLKFKIK